MANKHNPHSRTLRVSLQVAFLVTGLMSLGALMSADSFLSASAVVPAFALTLFPVTNFILILWILAKPDVRRVLSGKVLVNTPTFANRPLCENPGPDDLDLSVTVQVPVYTETFATIRQTIEHALAAVDAYNAVAGKRANLVVSDDALMLWADNDLPGCLDRAREKCAEERSEAETHLVERVDFYRRHGVSFVARPRPVPGRASTLRPGRFKKAGNLNRTLRLAEAAANRAAALGVDHDEALAGVLQDEAFRGVHAEGRVVIGDVILMLDKDSVTPRDALLLTVPEFGRDPRLAYTQHKTEATNDGENYFTGVMGVFTRLVFGLVFPAKALQGWMPPFMGHNGFVRKSVLADAGWWAEDRVGEDLDFTMFATACGLRGKFIAYENVAFGEQVTRTYSEESGKYNRYGFSILELILNPLSGWLDGGVFTRRFNRYIRSDELAWEHKLDLMVVYPFFYINLALIPLMTVFVPFVGVNVLIYALIFFLSLAPPLLLASQQEGERGASLGRRLFQFQALGFLFVSFGFSILKGFISFFSGSARVHFGVTSVDRLDHDRSLPDLLADMSTQLKAAAIMLGLVAVSYSWAAFHDLLTGTHLAVSSPVLFSVAVYPFLMSPAVMRTLAGMSRDSRAAERHAPGSVAAKYTGDDEVSDDSSVRARRKR